MRYLKPTLIGLSLLALGGCANPNTLEVTTRPANLSQAVRSAVSQDIAYEMRNPASAQFRNWRAYSASNGDLLVCFEVNGQNGFGGYVGFRQAYARVRGQTIMARQIDSPETYLGFATQACKEAASGRMMIQPDAPQA